MNQFIADYRRPLSRIQKYHRDIRFYNFLNSSVSCPLPQIATFPDASYGTLGGQWVSRVGMCVVCDPLVSRRYFVLQMSLADLVYSTYSQSVQIYRQFRMFCKQQ